MLATECSISLRAPTFGCATAFGIVVREGHPIRLVIRLKAPALFCLEGCFPNHSAAVVIFLNY